MIPDPALKAWKEIWDGGGAYFNGDWVKGSDAKYYRAKQDGGEVQDPVSDTSKTYWEKAPASSMANEAEAGLYNRLNELIEQFNLFLAEYRKTMTERR